RLLDGELAVELDLVESRDEGQGRSQGSPGRQPALRCYPGLKADQDSRGGIRMRVGGESAEVGAGRRGPIRHDPLFQAFDDGTVAACCPLQEKDSFGEKKEQRGSRTGAAPVARTTFSTPRVTRGRMPGTDPVRAGATAPRGASDFAGYPNADRGG